MESICVILKILYHLYPCPRKDIKSGLDRRRPISRLQVDHKCAHGLKRLTVQELAHRWSRGQEQIYLKARQSLIKTDDENTIFASYVAQVLILNRQFQ